MAHYYPIVIQAGQSLAGDSLGFHAYSLRIDNLTSQWLLEETSLAWIPPYSLGVCLRLYGTGVAIILNQAPSGQVQPAPLAGEQTIGVYSDQLRTEVTGTPVRQYSLVQAVSDLSQGLQPALPPAGYDRLWADAAGEIHHLHSNGTDIILADTPVTNAMLGPDVARANLLTNGGFEIWQRGNGPFAAGVGAYTADQWLVAGVGGDTISISRDTTNVDTGSGACAAVTFTKGTGSTNLSQNAVFRDALSLVGRAVSFSVRVRTATANAVRIGIYNGSAWTFSPYHPGTGTYQTLTVANITLNSNSAQAGIMFDASCTAYIDNASLVVGSQPANYVPLHPADEQARCDRYYETTLNATNIGGAIILRGYVAAASVSIGQSLTFRARKTVAPTLTVSGAATWTGVSMNLPPQVGGVGQDCFDLHGVSTGGPSAAVIYTSSNTGGWTAEANP